MTSTIGHRRRRSAFGPASRSPACERRTFTAIASPKDPVHTSPAAWQFLSSSASRYRRTRTDAVSFRYVNKISKRFVFIQILPRNQTRKNTDCRDTEQGRRDGDRQQIEEPRCFPRRHAARARIATRETTATETGLAYTHLRAAAAMNRGHWTPGRILFPDRHAREIIGKMV